MAAFCPESSSNPFPRSRTTLSIWWEVILGAQSDTESGRFLTPLPSFSGSFFFQLKKNHGFSCLSHVDVRASDVYLVLMEAKRKHAAEG